MKKRRLYVRSADPSIVEIILVVLLAAFAVALALGLPIWAILAVIAAFVAKALGLNPWLGVGVVGVLFLLRLAFGK